MAQNRKPPAYQEYAASMIAQNEFRMMSLAERGLLYTLRLECWVNERVPSDYALLAKILGFTEQEVRVASTQVAHFFARDGDFIVCPELDNYRKHLDEIRAKQIQGGKKGAATARENREKLIDGRAEVPPRSTTRSLVKTNTDKLNSNSVINKVLDKAHEEWIEDYDRLP